MTIPKTIFHYAPASLQTLINLKNGTLYFNKPASFNDPHDCFAKFDYFISDEAVEYFRNNRDHLSEDLTPMLQQHLQNIDGRFLKKLLLDSGERIVGQLIERSHNEFGVLCFSELKDHQLMWAHYADGFKGICLEFDTTLEPFSRLKKVEYTDEIQRFDIGKILFPEHEDSVDASEVIKVWTTKSAIWHYEEEWRAAHKIGGTLYRYEQRALKSIYFGQSINSGVEEIICLIMQGQNESVKFFKSAISSVSREMKFKQFTYTPYIKTTK